MIVQAKIYDGHPEFTTDGCGCCSIVLGDPEFGPLNKDKVLEHLKDNVVVIMAACVLLNIDFNEFINEHS